MCRKLLVFGLIISKRLLLFMTPTCLRANLSQVIMWAILPQQCPSLFNYHKTGAALGKPLCIHGLSSQPWTLEPSQSCHRPVGLTSVFITQMSSFWSQDRIYTEPSFFKNLFFKLAHCTLWNIHLLYTLDWLTGHKTDQIQVYWTQQSLFTLIP